MEKVFLVPMDRVLRSCVGYAILFCHIHPWPTAHRCVCLIYENLLLKSKNKKEKYSPKANFPFYPFLCKVVYRTLVGTFKKSFVGAGPEAYFPKSKQLTWLYMRHRIAPTTWWWCSIKYVNCFFFGQQICQLLTELQTHAWMNPSCFWPPHAFFFVKNILITLGKKLRDMASIVNKSA